MDSSDDDGRRAERGRRPAHDNMKSCATHLDRAKASHQVSTRLRCLALMRYLCLLRARASCR